MAEEDKDAQIARLKAEKAALETEIASGRTPKQAAKAARKAREAARDRVFGERYARR